MAILWLKVFGIALLASGWTVGVLVLAVRERWVSAVLLLAFGVTTWMTFWINAFS